MKRNHSHIKVYTFFCMVILLQWEVAIGNKSIVEPELDILMPILLKDPYYLSLNRLEQFKMFRKLYTFILDKKGLSAPKSRKHNYFLPRTRF